MTTLTEAARMGDFLLDFESALYCFESYNIVNAAQITDLAQIAGYPLKGVAAGTPTLALVADEEDVDGFLLSGPKLEDLASGATTPDKYLILARGPATVNASKFPATDIAGDSFTAGRLATEAAALEIICRTESATSETQSD